VHTHNRAPHQRLYKRDATISASDDPKIERRLKACFLPNVIDEPRRQPARGVRQHDA